MWILNLINKPSNSLVSILASFWLICMIQIILAPYTTWIGQGENPQFRGAQVQSSSLEVMDVNKQLIGAEFKTSLFNKKGKQ